MNCVAGSDDEVRVYDDQLPAAGRAAQLLPVHHLQPGPDRGGHRLHAGGARQARTRPVDTAVNTLVVFSFGGFLPSLKKTFFLF